MDIIGKPHIRESIKIRDYENGEFQVQDGNEIGCT
jgi:hypothetical protein